MERGGGDPQMARRVEVVVDSSVAVKWFSDEERSEEAMKLLDGHVQGSQTLWASLMLHYEVANALRYKPDYDLEKLNRATRSLLGLRLRTPPLETELILRAGEIAFDGGISIYDSVPVAIAESLNTICITADKATQYRKLKPKGYPVEVL